MSDPANIALAALLHDLGKLYQRAYWGHAPEGVSDWSHPAYTEWAIRQHRRLFEQAGLEPDWLAQTAARHHEGWSNKPQYQPQTPEGWCVALADTYASRERLEVDEKGSRAPDTPLKSVFANLRVQETYGQRDHGYSMVEAGREVGLKLGGAYPQARPNVSRDTYWRLAERLDGRLTELAKHSLGPEALLMNLLGIFQELLWNVPSDTQGEPDVSLFDHLRLTGAIAAALWAYHDGKATVEALRDETPEKFLLVLGDLGGIQGHIYRIQGAQTGVGGLAKRLRARSLEVSLAAEALGLELLQRTGFTPLQRIMSAGGKFYLLLPNTEAVHRALDAVRQGWEAWALQQGATLLPFLAAHPFAPGGFRAFSEVLKAAHQKLVEAKLKPLSSQLSTPYLTSGSTSLRPCRACGVRPAQSATDELCHGCERDGHMGRLIPKRTEIGFFPQDAPRPHYRFPAWQVALEASPAHTLRTRPDFTPAAHPWEVRLLAGHIPTLADALRQGRWRDLAEYQAWAKEQGLWEEEEEGRKADDPLTLAELAEFSTGAKYLGALMLDADRMGEAFATGFKDEEGQDSSSPSRIASLSRMLELFFAGEVLELIKNPQTYAKRLGWDELKAREKAARYPLIYSVYAGGDDLFLLGPWDVLLEFALDLQALYREFTQHPALTLSGGFVLVSPSLPIPLLAEAVQEAEQAAKNAGRNRLHLFGQGVPWDELRNLLPWVRDFRRHLEAEGKAGLSSALAYRLLRLWRGHQDEDEARRMRYKPLLAYALRERNEEIRKHYLQLTDHTQAAWQYLPVWVQWGLYLER
ncbi:type III-A CRISPR-associated protein Cas10/Csm1 [Meiothermus ruber]|uniref:CRISPR system single-strand-specific deoxyribonuclease Cas10/Csm1 (subtype III-A) n=1 Tax=Meiothermus ruber (strain ATCC 35948 / DSM 1279 / VKM B-1258 / 21) TaxID=504728 RepID=D3PL99_MEIRD|nr:type III-A CRISPR-associated protein Cas10/Csm1 [Meiothermus ruber]ADD26995.1 CRISPR-associated protein, Csm1 family [Meiothermus ruber DSM 1279]AGK03449.1 Csm1 family CRISPR-associated protein [Meiothermus ruber DSM 1279]MCL6530833.1 type III-A CRISPR-associated protein Cas10/Csm1 [Meiothermus ruber]